MKQRQTKRRIELYFAARVSAQTESDMGQPLLDTLPTFVDQRQLAP